MSHRYSSLHCYPTRLQFRLRRNANWRVLSDLYIALCHAEKQWEMNEYDYLNRADRMRLKYAFLKEIKYDESVLDDFPMVRQLVLSMCVCIDFVDNLIITNALKKNDRESRENWERFQLLLELANQFIKEYISHK